MLYVPAYGGTPIFGWAVKMKHLPNPTQAQINSFFGVNGTYSLYGGSRGRAFTVDGMLVGADATELNANEQLFLSYADEVARELYTTRGQTFQYVVFRGEFQPGDFGWFADGSGLFQMYKAVFHGLV